jgi:hypothetical protein
VREVVNFHFIDKASSDEATLGIQATEDLIAVVFSLRRHGDIGLMLRGKEWQQFLIPLQGAIAIAKAAEGKSLVWN